MPFPFHWATEKWWDFQSFKLVWGLPGIGIDPWRALSRYQPLLLSVSNIHFHSSRNWVFFSFWSHHNILHWPKSDGPIWANPLWTKLKVETSRLGCFVVGRGAWLASPLCRGREHNAVTTTRDMVLNLELYK